MCASCSYNGTRAYAQSKLANILHAKEIARQLKVEWFTVIPNQQGTSKTIPKINFIVFRATTSVLKQKVHNKVFDQI